MVVPHPVEGYWKAAWGHCANCERPITLDCRGEWFHTESYRKECVVRVSMCEHFAEPRKAVDTRTL